MRLQNLLFCGSGRAEPGAAAQSEMAQEGEAAAVKAEPNEAAQRLAWLPATAAAVSLRLAAFDAAVTYVPGLPPARDTLQVGFTAQLVMLRDLAMAVIHQLMPLSVCLCRLCLLSFTG